MIRSFRTRTVETVEHIHEISIRAEDLIALLNDHEELSGVPEDAKVFLPGDVELDDSAIVVTWSTEKRTTFDQGDV